MAALADQLDLRTAVIETVDDPSISDVWPRLLAMAENVINRRARHRSQITSASLSFTSGEASLPADFLEVMHLYDTSDGEMVQVPLAAVKASGSQYRYFAIDGSKVYIYGVSGTRTMEYYAKVPTISAAMTDTNWLLAAHPDVYLYAASVEAAKHLRKPDLIAALAPLLDMAFDELKIASDDARYGRARVRVAGWTP